MIFENKEKALRIGEEAKKEYEEGMKKMLKDGYAYQQKRLDEVKK